MIFRNTIPELVLGAPLMEINEGSVNVGYCTAPHEVWQHIHLTPLDVHLHEHCWSLSSLQTN